MVDAVSDLRAANDLRDVVTLPERLLERHLTQGGAVVDTEEDDAVDTRAVNAASPERFAERVVTEFLEEEIWAELLSDHLFALE